MTDVVAEVQLDDVPRTGPDRVVDTAAVPGRDLTYARTRATISSRSRTGGLTLLSVLAAVASATLAGVVVGAAWPARVVAVAVAGWAVLASRRPAGSSRASAASSAVRACLFGTVVAAVALHLARQPVAAVDDVLLIGATTSAVVALAAAVRAGRIRPPRVLVAGDLPQVRALAARWFEDSSVDVVGALALGTPAASAEAGLADLGIPSAGSSDDTSDGAGSDIVADIVDHLTDHPADLLVVATGPHTTGDDLNRLAAALDRTSTRVALISAAATVAPHRLDVEVVAGSTMTLIAPPGGPVAGMVKAATDRVLAALLLLSVAPLLAVLAVAIRLDSAGPAVFRQTRVGRDGRTFTLYKLRTMTADAERRRLVLGHLDDGNGMLFKIRQDPRVTRLGHVLRRTSLDELPQLVNVLRGEMSLVGPRPALPEEVARYSALERRRLGVKPGLTGPWQVSGRSELSRERSVRLDVDYVDNWRPAGDVGLLVRTVGAVLDRRGAY
jgi:exopolysaccharide biosynthesis polyprenyl glycosylphosphotransferase